MTNVQNILSIFSELRKEVSYSVNLREEGKLFVRLEHNTFHIEKKFVEFSLNAGGVIRKPKGIAKGRQNFLQVMCPSRVTQSESVDIELFRLPKRDVDYSLKAPTESSLPTELHDRLSILLISEVD